MKKIMQKIKDTSLPTKIFVGLGLGILAGIVIGEQMTKVEFIGDLWLNLIKMILVPLILFTLVTSITAQKDTKSLGKLGLKTMIYFTITTIIASFSGIAVSYLFKPGVGFDLVKGAGEDIEIPDDLTIQSFFTNLVSDNMLQAFTEGNILQVIVIALLLGIARLKMKDGDKKDSVISWFSYMNELIFSFIWIIISLSPIGVFFLMAGTIGEYGPEILGTFSKLIG